jgi:hypothetical protein
MKIIDIFPFFNELDILELRLRELDNLVDKFILVQSVETFTGLPKPFYYDSSDIKWSQWKDKIIEIRVPHIETNDPWVREKAPRRIVRGYLSAFDKDDLVMISDVDEIPDKNVVRAVAQYINPDYWISFKHRTYFYYLNVCAPAYPSTGTVVAPVSVGQEICLQQLREKRRRPVQRYSGGWHFTWQLPVERISTKLKSYAHTEWNIPELHDLNHLQDCVNRRVTFFKIDSKTHPVTQLEVDNMLNLPQEVQMNLSRYSHKLDLRKEL